MLLLYDRLFKEHDTKYKSVIGFNKVSKLNIFQLKKSGFSVTYLIPPKIMLIEEICDCQAVLSVYFVSVKKETIFFCKFL